MTLIYAIMNQKGGVAKTTTSDALAHHFAKLGLRTLLIDADPQGNLTTGMGVKNQDNLDHTIAELMMNTHYGITTRKEDYVIRITNNLDIIPSNIKLANIESSLTSTDRKEFVLKDALEEIKDDYDVILIDCCPSLGNLTINALTCSDRVLIPSAPEVYSAKGLELLITSVINVKRRYNQNLNFEGILYTRVDSQLKLFKYMKDMVNEAYGKHIHIFEKHIPQSTAVGLSLVETGRSIMFQDKPNPAVEAYELIAKELVERNQLLKEGIEHA